VYPNRKMETVQTNMMKYIVIIKKGNVHWSEKQRTG